MRIENKDDLSLAYTPGVAQACLEIQKDPEKSYALTGRGNLVAVVTDGTAVLGLGDIGPEAGMPVMEGIGVSAGNLVTPDMVKSMAENAILFLMANPVPEIMPDLALAAGAAVVGTGRSDFANQINNVPAFPGIFRGALDVRAKEINEEMKRAAAEALSALVSPDELSKDYILPRAFDVRIGTAVAAAVAKAARDSGAARA